MARRKAAETTAEAPAVTEPTAVSAPEAPPVEQDKPVTGHLANPSATPRPHNFAQQVKKSLPSKMSVSAGDMIVQLIDAGNNEMGIGIRVVFPEGSKNRPTAEEKEIIREHMKGENGRPGLNWDRHAGMWHAEIGADSPPARNVAIRLNAESRVEKLAEALKHHAADPVGYADMVKHQREQAAERDRIPD